MTSPIVSTAVRTATFSPALLIALFLAGTTSAGAQGAPTPAVDAATLARYDVNRNGVLDPQERAALEADQARAASAVTSPAPGAPTGSEEIVSLSPFEVVSDTKGYFASNTTSGTRFNTKLEDLGSSISVMTKEQMTDLAMLDINDVFLYAAGTEGTGTYTDLTIDRNGSVSDNVQLNPTQANRVRGIAAANVSLGNIETMGRVPVDPLATDAIEISRGPNANVFGLGNPSGTVNMVPAAANLSRNRSQAQVRADSYDGYRASLDVNQVLRQDLLAVRFSTAFQHEGFVRKPSGVNTVRYNGMVKIRPFKNTTIAASYSYYRMNGNRPNFTPPRDGVSYWLASGRPGWDPVAQVIHFGGQTLGPFTADTSVPSYFNRSFTGSGRSYLWINGGTVALWAAPQATASSNLLTTSLGLNTSGAGTARYMNASSAAGVTGGRFNNQPLFTTTPSVTDKSMYDWSDLNLASINRIMDETQTTSIQADQIVLSTPRQQLALQLGFMREDAERYQRNLVGIGNDNGQSGQLLVDVNERLLDNTPNPFFGRLFIGQDQPRTTRQPARWDTYRAQAAYRLDLRNEKNALRWLGLHQLTGYDEYKYRIRRQFSFKDAMGDPKPWIPGGISRGNQGAVTGGPAAAPNITRGYFRYYVSDTPGHVDYAPSDFGYGVYNFVYGNPTTGFVREPTLLRQVGVTDNSGGSSNLKQIIKTTGAVLQSHFLNGTIVTTFGLREDKVYAKAGAEPRLLLPDGITHDFERLNHWVAGDYQFNSGRTKTGGAVVRPFRDLAFVRDAAERGSGIGRYAADAVRGLAFTYNRSDSFTPADPKVDVFLRRLPNPTGRSKDYGIWLNMLENRFVLRFNHYENKAINSRAGDASTIASRVLRHDVAASANYLLRDRATDWVTAQNPTWTPQQVQAEVARQIGIPIELQNALLDAYNAGTLAATQDLISKGNELEINFNPTRYWTVAASATETRSMNANVSKAVNEWLAQRLPVWTTIVDQSTGALWWNTNYGGSQTAAQNYATFIETPNLVIRETEGKANPQVRRYNFRASTSYQLAGITEQKHLKRLAVGGAVRWEDKGAIGYYGRQSLPEVITSLDPNRPIYDKAHTYFDGWVRYRMKLWADKIGASLQLNVKNIQEGGRLQPIAVFPDGTPSAYRIVDPRQYILTATFDL